ncbi:hypothetical protein GCM10010123_15750 [Pilimelia anulata]|uniref:Glycosyl transferase n=1 Tax=Pilimelia anulata TaxID=53371 RepID=A0A8J3B423_9ACTN|nr:glycosyltransferase family 39 protein [Pilimelia anulata]GGJ87003.1 hypothetical protein GCM10010123_15750 [Pilimelia anulata]
MTAPAPATTPPPAPAGPAEPAPPAGRRRRAPRPLRGRPEDPRWVRPALLGLLAATAALYLWALADSGWANSFYAAAVQAGSVSWKAFFFGASDAAASITVDKTPLSLWPMALSARVFGMNAWSMLVPQALMGVASVGLLYAAVRRWYGPAAGLLAGAALATTPVAALMFRFNNPDALLVLLMVAGAYAVVRAVESGATKWLVWAGVFVGFGFLTKMLQVLLVVPAFGLTYLVAGPPRLRRRLGQLLLAGVAMVVSAGWYVAVVELIPASARPYVGGSQNNSLLELTLGYNGVGRLSGEEVGSVGGGQGGGWGTPGWLRMLDAEQGGQVAWLLPAALALLVVGLIITLRAARTDRTRAGFLLWGGWLLVTGGVFSAMQGIFHAYYTVALAPAIGALVGAGAAVLWPRRRHPLGALALAAAVAGSAVWGYVLLGRSADFVPALRWVVLGGGLLAAVLLLAARYAARLGVVAAAVAAGALLAGPAAYAAQTAGTAHTGSIPSAGPAVEGGRGGPGGGPGGRRDGNRGGQPPNGGRGGPGFPGGAPGQGGPGQLPGGTGTPPGGGFPGGTAPTGQTGTGTGTGTTGNGSTGTGNGTGSTGTGAGATGGTAGQGGPGGGGPGGLLGSREPGAALVALLNADADRYTWVGAAVGANNAAGYQLATGRSVMPIGGFNGSDPSPTLARFQQYVAAGRIHYFLGGSGPGGGGRGGSSAGSEITAWVAANYTAATVDGVTVYDLTSS